MTARDSINQSRRKWCIYAQWRPWQNVNARPF